MQSVEAGDSNPKEHTHHACPKDCSWRSYVALKNRPSVGEAGIINVSWSYTYRSLEINTNCQENTEKVRDTF